VDAKKIREIQAQAREQAAARERFARSEEGRRQRAEENQKAWDKKFQPYVDECVNRAAKAATALESSIMFTVEANDSGRQILDEVDVRLRRLGFFTSVGKKRSEYKSAICEYDDSGFTDYLDLEIFWNAEVYNRRVVYPARRWQTLENVVGFIGLLVILLIAALVLWPDVKQTISELFHPHAPASSETKTNNK